jgi:hypothetical protein
MGRVRSWQHPRGLALARFALACRTLYLSMGRGALAALLRLMALLWCGAGGCDLGHAANATCHRDSSPGRWFGSIFLPVRLSVCVMLFLVSTYEPPAVTLQACRLPPMSADADVRPRVRSHC